MSCVFIAITEDAWVRVDSIVALDGMGVHTKVYLSSGDVLTTHMGPNQVLAKMSEVLELGA